MTINKLLELQKILKERRTQLEKLTTDNSKTERFYGQTTGEKVVEPVFDAATLDTMVTNINCALFDIASLIKESNAVTKVETTFVFNVLMRPIQPKTK